MLQQGEWFLATCLESLPVCLHCGRLLWLEMNGKHVTEFHTVIIVWNGLHIYVFLNTHTHTYTYTYMCVHAHTHMRARAHAHIHTHMHTHSHMHTRARALTHAPAHARAHARNTHTQTHTHTHTHTHTCTHTCTRTHTHAHNRVIGNKRLHVQVVPQWVSNIDLYEYWIVIYMNTKVFNVGTVVGGV